MKIDESVVDLCNKNYIDLVELAFLYSLFFTLGWELNISPASINKLKRMGLIEDPTTISVVGENLVAELGSPIEDISIDTDKFEEFWNLYPADDRFREFPRTRFLRRDKAETRKQYQLALQRGTTHDNIMVGLRNEIAAYNSMTTNGFKYMKSSVNWLKTDMYKEFLEFKAEEKKLHGKELG